jgi:predicted  nucleic acid-binding Zn-ribbon protein
VIDSSSLLGKASSPGHRDTTNPEIVEVESTELINRDTNILPESKSAVTPIIDRADLNESEITPPPKSADIVGVKPTVDDRPIHILSSPERFDVEAELDSLSNILKSTDPHHLDPETEWTSISETLATIAAAGPIAHSQQLLEELRATREQIAISHAQLQSLDRKNSEALVPKPDPALTELLQRVDTVDTSLLEVKQLKFRTQQLARHSKNQIEKVREMLASLEQIRTEIITGLDEFGGYDEIHLMLSQLAETRHELVLAHDRLKTGQEAFYESLQAIGEQVAANSHDSEAKLLDYQESISHLTQEISADRLKIAMISSEMSLKLSEISNLSTNITSIHGQIVDKSQVIQTSITRIDREFGELSQSVQKEKEQFYELTAETIDKVEGLRSQFVDLTNHNRVESETIEQLRSEIESIRRHVSYEAEQQLDRFDRHYDETISTWGDLQARQKASTRDIKRFYNWLWLLSFAVAIVFVLLITVLLTIR